MKMKKSIAIIPARGGSKGIPRKNIKLLVDKPLIAYTIDAAKQSKHLDYFYVSTEDDEIAQIASDYGAKIMERPNKLSHDSTSTVDVIFHLLETDEVKKFNSEIIILLQPTSPLRNTADIDTALDIFMKTDCDSVISMCKVDHSPYWCFKYEGDKFKPLFGDECLKMRRQELPDVYRPNGAIYITTIKNLYKNNGFYCDKIVPYIMPPERSIDIDEEIDFKLAELLIQEDTTNANHG